MNSRKQRAGTRPKNPVRGCLLVEKRGPEDNFLFVFRRRGLGNFNPSAKSKPRARYHRLPHFVPPKNKKEIGKSGGRFYNQATPNRVKAQAPCVPRVFSD